MYYEPTVMEILLTKFVFLSFGRSVYREFSERLPVMEDSKVLDYGCGMGTVAYFLSKRIETGHIDCIDISHRWINACRKTMARHKNVSIFHKNAFEEICDLGTYDLVFCHFVLHDIQTKHFEEILKTISSLIKPNGYFIYREPIASEKELETVNTIANKYQLALVKGRVTDVPLMGNTIERIFVKR